MLQGHCQKTALCIADFRLLIPAALIQGTYFFMAVGMIDDLREKTGGRRCSILDARNVSGQREVFGG